MHDEPEDVYESEGSTSIDYSTQYRVKCAFCSGTGVHPATMKSLSHGQCPVCTGRGIIELKTSRDRYHHCHTCDGSGRGTGSEDPVPCSDCQGTGIVKKS